VLGGTSGSISSIELSEFGSASITSSAQLGSRHNSGGKSSLVTEGEDGGSVVHNVHVGVVLKTREHLSAWYVEELDGKTFGVTTSGILNFLVKSRESDESWIANSRLEDSLGEHCWKVGSNVEGSINATNGGEVEGSSVESWELSLGLEQTDVGVKIVVYFVNVIEGEGRLLSKNEVLAVGCYVTRARKSGSSIRKSLC